jgi:amino acid adenylation domain-containing protein
MKLSSEAVPVRDWNVSEKNGLQKDDRQKNESEERVPIERVSVSPEYWECYLAGAPALELPTDHPRPAKLGVTMGVETRALAENLRARLARFAESPGRDVTSVSAAAFAAVLYRYTAQEKFVVGILRPEMARSGGESVPVVADFSDRPTLGQLALRFEEAVENGSNAGAMPADLAAGLGIEADLSRHAIFQAAFSAVTSEVGAEPSSFSSFSSFNGRGTAGLDLYLELVNREIANSGELRLYYNLDLFERGTAKRLLGHWQRLVESAIENVETSSTELAISKLPMLTDAELHEHLVERNQTARDFPERCLHELFEASAAKFPNEIAAVYANEQLTYAELNARANQIAHFLRERGVGRNARVGICLPRSLDFAAAILGVLKAGGTCVPLDPKYPSERLSYMLSDVAAPIVLTERGLLQAGIPAGTKVAYVSGERANIAKESRENPKIGSTASDVAYIIYTSGSTGRPRGVLLPHAGLANYMQGAAEMFELAPGDRMLQFCSISFDAALEEIYATWTAGATLVFRMDEVSLEPSEFLAWMDEQKITAVDLPTAYWHEWVYALPSLTGFNKNGSNKNSSTEKVPATLRLVIVGGEKASPEAYATWHKMVGSVRNASGNNLRNKLRWVNTYGPAEASVVATAYEPEQGPNQGPHDEASRSLPIGRPVANARVYLLDPDLNPVPVGVPGELHIAGAGVAQGYLNLPEVTREKFVADPFCKDASARMYKTGDLAKYLPSGELEFVGRRDNQVKIRGFRIEPGEIETVLAKHAGVKEAAVVVREDSPGNKRLVGYVVRSEEGSAGKPRVLAVTEGELRRHIKSHLPEYMVPSEFVFLDAMPLTPNGKINRRALPAMKSNSSANEVSANEQANEISADGTSANNSVQAELLKIWEELLGRKPIGLRDNFFDLGGHSLLAARLMHRVKQTMGETLPLAALLQAPTVEQLAEVLQGDYSRHWSSLVAMQPEGSKPPFFCVHGVGGNVIGFQKLAWRMRPDYPFYGLQSQGLDGQRPLHTSIEDMAAHYIEEIRTVQPKGPYQLGGFSLGGVVAYEIARQLEARGEEVALLVLFDTYATNPEQVKLGDILRNPGLIQLRQLPEEVRRKINRMMIARRTPEYLKKVMRTNAQAGERYTLDRYTSRPFRGKAVLLRANDNWLVKGDPYTKWSEVVDELETIEIGGFHMDLLHGPEVGELAECLKNCIDKASAKAEMDDAELVARNAG